MEQIFLRSSDKNKTDPKATNSGSKPSLLKNFLNLISGRFAGDIGTFFLFIVLTREFGEEGIGQYSFATMIGGFCLLVADFGLYNYTIKEVGRHRHAARHRYADLVLSRLCCTAITLTLFCLIIVVAPISPQAKWIWGLIGTSQLFLGLMSGFAALFIAHERMEIGAIIETSASWLVALCGIAVALLGGPLIAVCATIALAYFVSLIFAGVYAFRFFQVSWGQFSLKNFRDLLLETLPFALRQLLHQAVMRMDIIFIGVLLGASQVGAYAVAYRLIAFLFLTFSYVSIAVFPATARLFKDSHEEFVALARRSLGVVILVSVPAAIGIMFVATEAIELIFGEGFEASARLLQGLAVLVAMFPMAIVMQMLLDSSDRQTFTMISELVGVLVGLAAHSILFPLFGLQGAVTAAIISETAILMVVIFLLRDIISWPQLGARLGIAALGSGPFSLLLLALPPLSIFISIPLAGAVYLGVIACFRDVREQELNAVIHRGQKADA